jgi:ATP-dependent Clp protease protease subunit
MFQPDPPRPTDAMRARLFERRIVIVDGDLTDEVAARIAAELMTLDAIGDDRVELLLNSAGGTLEAAFTIMDVVDLLGVPAHVTCVGRAEGAALGVLAVGAKRSVVPHASLRFSAPTSSFEGRADEVVRWAGEQQDQLRRFAARLAGVVDRPVEWLLDAMHDRRRIEPDEAIRVGLIDDVARSNLASVSRFDGGPLGFRPDRGRR